MTPRPGRLTAGPAASPVGHLRCPLARFAVEPTRNTSEPPTAPQNQSCREFLRAASSASTTKPNGIQQIRISRPIGHPTTHSTPYQKSRRRSRTSR